MCDIAHMIDEYHTENGISKLEASERMGINYPTYKRKTNEHDDYEITATEVVPFIRAHNMDFRLLDRMEQRLGRIAFSIPETGDQIDTDKIAAAIDQLSKSIALMAEIIKDGIVDNDEKKKLNANLINMIQRVCNLQATINNK